MEIANQHTETTPLLQESIQAVKGLTKCAAVGIRLLDEHGNIPYTACTGFTRQFYEKESPLNIKADKCMCINVIKGDTDPRLSFYTENGSFYMNGTTRFLSTVSNKEKGETRNVCNAIGYQSIALIPIRTDNRIVGLIHLADCAENMVPLGIVKQLEQASTALGIGIQRAQAEEALRRRTADLESSNKELESFAYSVSHDLRSPLRGIDGYSKILLDDYKDLLNKDGRFVLGEVRTAALEMGALIDDLLEYSRLGRCGLKQTTVDMNALFKEIFEEFKQSLQHRSLELDLGPLPVVRGDGTLLRSLVRNLVDNAVKFTEPRDTAIITVGTCDKPEPSSEFTFFVRDNGVGFDMHYAHKLFGVFQRLHTQGEFQGYGGRVWAEVEPDAGAVFYFTLPREIQAAPVYRTADLHIIQSP